MKTKKLGGSALEVSRGTPMTTKELKSEKITVTLTLGQIDALVASGQLTLEKAQTGYIQLEGGELADLTGALQELDEAVNL